MGTQISKIGHNSNMSQGAEPNMGAKSLPSDPISAECETLVRGDFGTNVFHEVKSEFVAYAKRVFMLFPLGRDHDVIGKQSRGPSMVFDQKHERP